MIRNHAGICPTFWRFKVGFRQLKKDYHERLIVGLFFFMTFPFTWMPKDKVKLWIQLFSGGKNSEKQNLIWISLKKTVTMKSNLLHISLFPLFKKRIFFSWTKSHMIHICSSHNAINISSLRPAESKVDLLIEKRSQWNS